MAKSSSKNEVFDNYLCSKHCKKNNDSLNSKITDLTDELFDANNLIYHYKLALAQVESKLVEYKEKEVKYCEKIRTLEFHNESNNKCIEILKKKLKTLKLEKDGVDGKLAGLLKASKDLDNLIESQRPLPTVESTSRDDQNRNSSASKNGESTDSILSKPAVKFVKAAERNRVKKGTSRSQNKTHESFKSIPVAHRPYRPPEFPPVNRKLPTGNSHASTVCCCCSRHVNTDRPKEVINRRNWVNNVKASACWVWKPVKSNSASIILKRYDYVDVRGRSRDYSVQQSPCLTKQNILSRFQQVVSELDKNKDGLGYSAIPPLPAQLYLSSKKDLSWTGLPECDDDTVTDYSRPSPTVESTSVDDQNRNSSASENGESTDSILSKPAVKFVKAAERSTTNNVETVKKPSVKYAEMNWVNNVKASSCWVWKPVKSNSASIILKRYDYVDVRGRSRCSYYRKGLGKGYMSRGVLEVNAPKKKKVEVPRRPKTIPVANNLLEDHDQAVDLVTLVNLEENKQEEKEWRSKVRHVALVLDKEVNKMVDEAYNDQLKFKIKVVEQVSPYTSIWETSDDEKTKSDNNFDNGDNDDTAQTDQFVLIHGKEKSQPEPQPHSPSITTTSQEDVSRYLNETPEVEIHHNKHSTNKVKAKMSKKTSQKAIQKKNDFKMAIMQKLANREQRLNALSHDNHEDSLNFKRSADADERRQEQKGKIHHDAFSGKHAHWFKQSGEKKIEELPEQSWFNELVDVEKDSWEHELQIGSRVMFSKSMKNSLNKDKITKEDLEGPAFEFLKNMFKNSIKLEYNKEKCYLAMTDIIDWPNPEGDRFYIDLSKPLPLEGPPGRKTIPMRYFFNKELTHVFRNTTEMMNWVFITREIIVNGSTKETLDAHHHMMSTQRYEIHAWTKKDKETTRSMLEKIEKMLKERRRMRRLEFVMGRRNKTDYIHLVRPE
nr:hypothetical protein [Tanacetum cinerariifolium]